MEGLCDGAEDLQNWLQSRCDTVTLDFYHMTEYVSGIQESFGHSEEEQMKWLQETLHEMKHIDGSAEDLLAKIEARAELEQPGTPQHTNLKAAAIYFGRNLDLMEYSLSRECGLPIGSGWIEAACKCVLKQRVGLSGAR